MFLFLTVVKLCFPSAERQHFIQRTLWSALHELGISSKRSTRSLIVNTVVTANAGSPIKVEWSSSVMQRAAACQIQLIDLSAGSHQGDNALAVPVRSSVVQSRPARYNRGQLWSQVTPAAGFGSSAPAIQYCLPSQMIFYIQVGSTTQQQIQTVDVPVSRTRRSQQRFVQSTNTETENT